MLKTKFDERQTLVDVLQQYTEQDAARRIYTYLEDGEEAELHLSVEDLHAQACVIAQHVIAFAQKGERALLLYPSGLAFVSAFFGCLYAGVVAVPAYPPRRNKPDPRLLSIIQDAKPTVVLTTDKICTELSVRAAEMPQLNALKWLATDICQAETHHRRPDVLVDPSDLAFLQYTSGSTGQPKGVMVAHENLMHNERMIAEAFHHTPESIMAGWLPLFHDMGLVGNLLQPLYVGFPLVWMSPMSFLQKPVRWLQMISRYQATSSGGPNFAYDLCVEKISAEQCKGLDLSSWQTAFNGAEPIRASTIARFTETFAPYGFHAEAMYPCYGMAESSLFITGSSPSELPIVTSIQSSALEEGSVVEASSTDAYGRTQSENENNSDYDFAEQQLMVSSGRSWLDQRIHIVNPETRELCQPDQVGEIWVASQSVTKGYWEKEELTAEIFDAKIAGSGNGPFLRTGDLGFMKDDELYVSGRLKDLIIIRGRNYYPQDIEEVVAECHTALRSGSSAAFAVEHGTRERLAIVQEVERSAIHSLDVEEVFREIRLAVAGRYELQVDGIQLLRPMSIPKTSSGKIQRHACKDGYLKSTLKVVDEWKSAR